MGGASLHVNTVSFEIRFRDTNHDDYDDDNIVVCGRCVLVLSPIDSVPWSERKTNFSTETENLMAWVRGHRAEFFSNFKTTIVLRRTALGFSIAVSMNS